jgi:hypothetical protein
LWLTPGDAPIARGLKKLGAGAFLIGTLPDEHGAVFHNTDMNIERAG